MDEINDDLRNCVLLLRKQRIKYKEIAEYLEISANSFYGWINGHYNFGWQKCKKLNEIIDILKE